MPVPATSNTIAPPSDLAKMSTEELRAALAKIMATTVAQLVRLAWIVRLLEERGEDLSDLRVGLIPYLRQIAYGQIVPEVVMRYAEHPAIVQAIASLPLSDQERLGRGEHVPLAIQREDGAVAHHMVDPISLQRNQVRRVFARDRIRSAEEQVILLEERPERRPPPADPVIGGLQVDRKRGGLVVGRRFVPVATITEALSQLAKRPEADADAENDGRTCLVNIMFTQSEYDSLREAAHRGRSKMSTLVRQAARAAGLI
jgi:hypothetical protein